MWKFLMSILPILTAMFSLPQEPKLSAEEEQVWEMEEKYWQTVEARDHKGYVALWDEEFVGWPYDSPAPVRKDFIRSDHLAIFEGLKKFKLERQAIQGFNGVAVAYYVVTAVHEPKDGSSATVTFRCTHTWRNSNGAWHIIGGMSAPSPASKSRS